MVSRGKMNLIVESLDETHHRMPAFFTDRVTNLGDIAMYTDADDVPLWKVLKSVGEQEQNKLVSFNYKKADSKQLREYFAKVLPSFDQDRVHDSDIKKLLQWYDSLVKNDMTDFETIFSPEKKESDEEATE